MEKEAVSGVLAIHRYFINLLFLESCWAYHDVMAAWIIDGIDIQDGGRKEEGGGELSESQQIK
jgi:hypothetical protein